MEHTHTLHTDSTLIHFMTRIMKMATMTAPMLIKTTEQGSLRLKYLNSVNIHTLRVRNHLVSKNGVLRLESCKDATDGLIAATIIEWFSFLHSTNGLCFSSARRHYYVSGNGITQISLELQLQCPE